MCMAAPSDTGWSESEPQRVRRPRGGAEGGVAMRRRWPGSAREATPSRTMDKAGDSRNPGYHAPRDAPVLSPRPRPAGLARRALVRLLGFDAEAGRRSFERHGPGLVRGSVGEGGEARR